MEIFTGHCDCDCKSHRGKRTISLIAYLTTGAVLVTTPQDIALSDVRRGATMFKKVKVPVLGIVENMSIFVCPNCGHSHHVFGHEGAKRLAKELDMDVIGKI